MVTKKDIRKDVLQKRRAISEEKWEENTRKINEKVLKLPYYLESDAIYIYIDYKREVGTRTIIEHAFSEGKCVYVPKIIDNDMYFCQIYSYKDLHTGYKGIMEPSSDVTAVQDKGLMIVPGVAFDRNRNRVGYGKGFYDRYLGQKFDFKTVALAHELQVLDYVPHEEHDFKPEILITEENIYVS